MLVVMFIDFTAFRHRFVEGVKLTVLTVKCGTVVVSDVRVKFLMVAGVCEIIVRIGDVYALIGAGLTNVVVRVVV